MQTTIYSLYIIYCWPITSHILHYVPFKVITRTVHVLYMYTDASIQLCRPSLCFMMTDGEYYNTLEPNFISNAKQTPPNCISYTVCMNAIYIQKCIMFTVFKTRFHTGRGTICLQWLTDTIWTKTTMQVTKLHVNVILSLFKC